MLGLDSVCDGFQYVGGKIRDGCSWVGDRFSDGWQWAQGGDDAHSGAAVDEYTDPSNLLQVPETYE